MSLASEKGKWGTDVASRRVASRTHEQNFFGKRAQVSIHKHVLNTQHAELAHEVTVASPVPELVRILHSNDCLGVSRLACAGVGRRVEESSACLLVSVAETFAMDVISGADVACM